MIEEAKALIELGLPIIPLCPPDHAHMSQKHMDRCKCPGKMPLIKDWVSQTKTTVADLASWQQQFRNFNIGMPLGDASGYCGIDVDGEAGVKLLLEMSKGDLPGTWEFNTSAGSRLIYKIPAGIKTKKFKQTGAGPHEECALICTGQQTVMPPSVHASGVVYRWVDKHSPFDMDCAMAPTWLVNAIKQDPAGIATELAKAIIKNPPKDRDKFDFASEFGDPEDYEGDEGDEYANDDEIPFATGSSAGMSFDLPPGAPESGKASRGRKAKHKTVVTEDMLTQPIPEGSRDNSMTAIVGHYCANRDLRRLGKDAILQICLQHNQNFCQPPLEDQAIIDKVNYFFDMESDKDESYKRIKAEKAIFEATTMAKNVIKHLHNQGVVLQYDQFTHMYYYTMQDEGPWQSTHNNTLINRWIREVIISPHYGDPLWDKRSYIEETRAVMEEMFTSPFKAVSDFDLGSHSEELSKYIVINDGMLNWKTKEVIPWDPTYHTTLSFDIDYDANAECPHFVEYLTEWLPDEKVRMIIQEFLGYCLIPNTNFRKALFLFGKGRNGKSIFIEFMQEFFGPLSSTLSYDALFQRFGPANLKDKLVNIYDDTNVSFAKDTGIAKNLIAGGQISAEFKGKDHFTFTNVARIIFSAQETPRTSDNSLAWYDRWYFIKFPNTFRASNTKKEEMMTNMRIERSGIFNWMLDGLRRLMTQDGFTQSSVVNEYTQEYRGLNDNVVQFLNTYCHTVNPDDTQLRISFNNLYKVYELFTEKDNLRTVSKKVFKARMEDSGYKIKTGRVGNSNQQYFEGVALNYENDEVSQYLLEIRIILTQGL